MRAPHFTEKPFKGKEYDRVKLRVAQNGFAAGATGFIVDVHDKGRAYEVEMDTPKDVITVYANNLN